MISGVEIYNHWYSPEVSCKLYPPATPPAYRILVEDFSSSREVFDYQINKGLLCQEDNFSGMDANVIFSGSKTRAGVDSSVFTDSAFSHWSHCILVCFPGRHFLCHSNLLSGFSLLFR